MELLYLWCKEGWQKSMLTDYHTQKQALSRFFVGAMLLTDPVLDGTTGRYFYERREEEPNPQTEDAEARRRLWELAERAVGAA